MASRRMLDKNFILSDHFTTLNWAAQLLYIRLMLSADDDGFVANAQTQQRMIGTRYQPLKHLEEAHLIHTFDSGVTLLLHWNVHNSIRKNAYIPTQYISEKALVILDKSKIYRLKTEEEMQTQIAPQDRTEQNKKEQNNIEKERAQKPASGGSLSNNDFEIFWESYPRKAGKEKAEWIFKSVNVPLETLMTALEAHKKSPQWVNDNGAFIPHPATWLKNRRWEDQLPQQPPYAPLFQPGEAEMEMVKRILAETGT